MIILIITQVSTPSMLPVTTGVALNCLVVVSHDFVTSQTLHLLTHAGVGVKQET